MRHNLEMLLCKRLILQLVKNVCRLLTFNQMYILSAALVALDSKCIVQVMTKVLFVIEIKYSHAGIDCAMVT